MYYAVCSTGASTATKIVTIDGITELYTGLSIRVKFSNYHSSGTPKLNLNELGAVNIVKYGTTNEDPRGWRPGEVLDLVYDGANWVVTDGGDASTDYYGVTKLSNATNSTSTTMAATPSAVKAAYDLANGKQAAIHTGSITTTTTWSGSGPYTQTVTVTGATVTANSKVDIQPDAAAIAQLITDGVQALYIENNGGTLTMYAVGAAPSAAVTLQATITEVTA